MTRKVLRYLYSLMTFKLPRASCWVWGQVVEWLWRVRRSPLTLLQAYLCCLLVTAGPCLASRPGAIFASSYGVYLAAYHPRSTTHCSRLTPRAYSTRRTTQACTTN